VFGYFAEHFALTAALSSAVAAVGEFSVEATRMAADTSIIDFMVTSPSIEIELVKPL
jgi:hypothetical protein